MTNDILSICQVVGSTEAFLCNPERCETGIHPGHVIAQYTHYLLTHSQLMAIQSLPHVSGLWSLEVQEYLEKSLCC